MPIILPPRYNFFAEFRLYFGDMHETQVMPSLRRHSFAVCIILYSNIVI